jgi:hypothetical protein
MQPGWVTELSGWLCYGCDFVVLKVLTVRKIMIEMAIMAAATGAE